jgi:hypothetical protein
MGVDVVDDTGFILAARYWATQTVMFALGAESNRRTTGAIEVVEQLFIRTGRIVERLFSEAVADHEPDAPAATVGLCFVSKVLAWVGEWHLQTRSADPALPK